MAPTVILTWYSLFLSAHAILLFFLFNTADTLFKQKLLVICKYNGCLKNVMVLVLWVLRDCHALTWAILLPKQRRRAPMMTQRGSLTLFSGLEHLFSDYLVCLKHDKMFFLGAFFCVLSFNMCVYVACERTHTSLYRILACEWVYSMDAHVHVMILSAWVFLSGQCASHLSPESRTGRPDSSEVCPAVPEKLWRH